MVDSTKPYIQGYSCDAFVAGAKTPLALYFHRSFDTCERTRVAVVNPRMKALGVRLEAPSVWLVLRGQDDGRRSKMEEEQRRSLDNRMQRKVDGNQSRKFVHVYLVGRRARDPSRSSVSGAWKIHRLA